MKLEKHLRERRDAGRKLLVPYVTAGITDDWVDLVRAVDDAGADAIEIGLPFSDPVMDGPTIQAASDVALARGISPVEAFNVLRTADIQAPLVAMTYYNLVFRMGDTRFASEANGAGIAGVIVPDLPLEELDPWASAANASEVATVLLAAPNTTDERLERLASRSQGFIYGVNLMGVTGERSDVAASSLTLAARLKRVTDLPVIMGFGISTPEQAATVAEGSDGVVIASVLMRMVLDGSSPIEVAETVARFRAALS